MKKLWFILLMLVFVACNKAFAVKMDSLYQAEIPIPAQTDDLKAQAITEGFLEVLIKLSGDPTITNNPVIKENLGRADYYVHELSYSPATTDSSQYHIRIQYDPDDVNRLLKRAGIAYWGATRPLILVWLVVKTPKYTQIISNEIPGSIFKSIRDQGRKYGIPLIFPMMDMADLSQVSPDDVGNMNLSLLKEAAKRYSPDAILIGWLTQGDDGNYKSEWQLILDKQHQWRWASTSQSANSIMGSIMNQVSQTLAKQYVEKAPDAPELWVKLEVINVTEREDLNQLLKYLKQLSPVREVKLMEVSSDVVELSVRIRGSLASFMNNAILGKRLSLKLQDRADNKLVYVWVH